MYCNTTHNKTRQETSLDGSQQMGGQRKDGVYMHGRVLLVAGKWIEIDIVMLSEISQIQKESLIHIIKKKF